MFYTWIYLECEGRFITGLLELALGRFITGVLAFTDLLELALGRFIAGFLAGALSFCCKALATLRAGSWQGLKINFPGDKGFNHLIGIISDFKPSRVPYACHLARADAKPD